MNDVEFRPSAAHRWFSCPASVRMSAHFGEDTTNAAAREGTLAHEIAEHTLRISIIPRLYPSCDEAITRRLLADSKATKTMLKHVNDYAWRVESLLPEYDYGVYIEKRLEYEISQGMKIAGTIDALIVDRENSVIRVIDFKYGRMKVDLTNNPQLHIYALLAHKHHQNFDKVIVHIIQPRIKHYPSLHLDKHDLRQFESKLKSKMYDSLKTEIQFVVGEHCRYCPAKMECSAYKLPKLTNLWSM